MTNLGRVLRRLLGDRRGISSVEYALLLAVVGGGIVVAASNLGGVISDEMNEAADCISGAAASTNC